MSDFYEILMNQPEEEAKDIALSLELFVNGSLNIFNHQTNVDVDNRFTVYGIRDLGTELSPITMLVMMESIQNRIIENGKRGVATWLYIDELLRIIRSCLVDCYYSTVILRKMQDGTISKFDGSLWGSMVEFATVGRDKDITVTFRDGSEIKA